MVSGTPIDIEKMRSIGVISKRTRPLVVEGKDERGRFKAVTDENNATVTERNTGQDVIVRPSAVNLETGVQ